MTNENLQENVGYGHIMERSAPQGSAAGAHNTRIYTLKSGSFPLEVGEKVGKLKGVKKIELNGNMSVEKEPEARWTRPEDEKNNGSIDIHEEIINIVKEALSVEAN